MTDEPFRGRATAVPSVLREPALPILLLAWLAMLRREYVPDIVLFGGAAVLLVIAERRAQGRAASAEPASRSRHRVPGLAATGLVALVMATLPRSGWLDASFGVVGVVVLVICLWPSPEGQPGIGRHVDEPAGWWVWPVLGVTLGLVALWSFLHQVSPMVDSPAHPSISSLVEPGLDHGLARLLALWLWLLGGWWLLRRVRAWGP